MKKPILTIALAILFCMTTAAGAYAAALNVTKPNVKLDLSKEKSAVTNKLNQIEQKQKDLEEQHAKKQAEVKAKNEQKQKEIQQKNQQRKDAIKNFKDSFK